MAGLNVALASMSSYQRITKGGEHSNPVFSEFHRILWCGSHRRGCVHFSTQPLFLKYTLLIDTDGVIRLNKAGAFTTEESLVRLQTEINKLLEN